MGRDTRLLLDQGLPRCSCIHVGEVGLARAEDTDIVNFAREHALVIVTLDADFHALLATSMASTPSVIRLRLQGLDALPPSWIGGCLVTVKSNKTTCHRLPTGAGG